MRKLNDLLFRVPGLIAVGVTAGVAWLFSFLVLHGVITNTHASALTQEVLPTVIMIAWTLTGIAVHKLIESKFVADGELWIEHLGDRVGLHLEGFFGELNADAEKLSETLQDPSERHVDATESADPTAGVGFGFAPVVAASE